MLERLLGIAIVVGTVGSAAAEPLMRFGLTTGANRQTREAAEAGPMIAAGGSSGRFTGEATYSYLSMMDGTTNIHRAGATLRADLATWGTPAYMKTFYSEVGVAQRWGSWRIGNETLPAERSQNEVHVGMGYQLDRKWQLGLRVGLARPDANQPVMCPPGFACRMIEMDSPTDLVGSVTLEWMYLLNR